MDGSYTMFTVSWWRPPRRCSTVCAMFTDIKPILEIAGDSRKVILTPIPIYLHQPCCQDQEPVKDFSFRVGPKGASARWGPDKLSNLGAGRVGGST